MFDCSTCGAQVVNGHWIQEVADPEPIKRVENIFPNQRPLVTYQCLKCNQVTSTIGDPEDAFLRECDGQAPLVDVGERDNSPPDHDLNTHADFLRWVARLDRDPGITDLHELYREWRRRRGETREQADLSGWSR